MPYKDPQNWPLLNGMLVVAASMFGGLVKWMHKMLADRESFKPRKLSFWLEFIAEQLSSAFIGLLVFMACMSLEVDLMMCGTIAGGVRPLGRRDF